MKSWEYSAVTGTLIMELKKIMLNSFNSRVMVIKAFLLACLVISWNESSSSSSAFKHNSFNEIIHLFYGINLWSTRLPREKFMLAALWAWSMTMLTWWCLAKADHQNLGLECQTHPEADVIGFAGKLKTWPDEFWAHQSYWFILRGTWMCVTIFNAIHHLNTWTSSWCNWKRQRANKVRFTLQEPWISVHNFNP